MLYLLDMLKVQNTQQVVNMRAYWEIVDWIYTIIDDNLRINPFNAEATFIQSARMQRFLKTI